MTITPEQKQAVATWVAAGDNISSIQKKLAEEFKISLTYRDVRFLVDDLNLQLKDPAPSKGLGGMGAEQPSGGTAGNAAGQEKKGFLEKAKEKLGLTREEEDDVVHEDPDAGEDPDDLPSTGNVKVEVDKLSLIPGALASGTVTFSDGVTGKWIVDQYGRPGFTEISKPGYRPNQDDAQAFMVELSRALQKRGF